MLTFLRNICIGFIFCLTSLSVFSQRSYAPNSVLATGNWYKIAVTKPGVYKVDVAFFTSLGFSGTISSASIRVFGNGGSMLDEDNNIARIDDLYENAIEMNDGGDGVFNNSDYFLFYASGTDKWLKDSINKTFNHQKNLYSDTAYYFISVNGTGKRIKTLSQTITANNTVTAYDERYFYENDKVNFLNSGKEWYGEEFSTQNGNVLSRNFTVDFSGFISGQPLKLNSSLASRSIAAASTAKTERSCVIPEKFSRVSLEWHRVL